MTVGTFVGFLSFWPEWRERGREAAKARDFAGLQGSFDLAVQLEAAAPARAAAALLTLAAALTGAPGPSPAHSGAAVSLGLPEGLAYPLVPANGGWVLVGLPDQEAWLTFAMAFLSHRVYRRTSFGSAWHTAAVADLASLVLATHKAEDIEGTCETYGVPCVALRSGAELPAFRYGAVLPVWPAFAETVRRQGLTAGLRQAMPAAFARDVLIEAPSLGLGGG